MIEFAIGAAVMAVGVWIGAMVGGLRRAVPARAPSSTPVTSLRSRLPWSKKPEPEKPIPTRQAPVAQWPGGTMGGLARDETPQV